MVGVSVARAYLEAVVRSIIKDPLLTTKRMMAESLLCSMLLIFALPDALVLDGTKLATLIEQTAGMWSVNQAEGLIRITAYRLEGCNFGKHINGDTSSSKDLCGIIEFLVDRFGGQYRFGRARVRAISGFLILLVSL